MDSPIPPDPYKTLGVEKDAPLATVRSAHRKLVLTCHPDKVTDESAKKAAADKFHLVQQAYEILSDETRRERYDERVKLAELRAQMMKERGSARIIPGVEIRGGPAPKRTHEMRDNTVYEYREPREPAPRSRAYEEEDYFQPRYQEVRPKKYDDRTFVPPPPRKTSGRGPEEKRKVRDLEEDARERRKEMARAEEKARNERSRKRDQMKRKDRETTSSRKFAASVEDDDSDSSSNDTYIRPRREDTPKKRYEDEKRRDREEPPRRSAKYDPYDEYDDKHVRAQDYIQQTRSSVEPEPRRLQPHNRSYSYVERPPPPPSAPIVPLSDSKARRPAAKDSRRREASPPPRLTKKDRRMTEIVDPPPSTRKPSLSGFSSDPKGLKNLMTPKREGLEPRRSSTLEHPREDRVPTLPRASTMPSKSRHNDTAPVKPSKLKEQHDSGYSSRSSRTTPELSPAPSPQMKTTRYRYDSSDEETEVTIVPEPEEMHRRPRESSPPKSRRDRPSMPGREPTSTRSTPMRTGSYMIPPEQMSSPRQPPTFIRTESGRPPPLKSRPSTRGSGPLYGEVPVPDPYEIINQSPKLRQDDIRYANYVRRGSTDDDREYSPSHNRPDFSRSHSRAVRA